MSKAYEKYLYYSSKLRETQNLHRLCVPFGYIPMRMNSSGKRYRDSSNGKDAIWFPDYTLSKVSDEHIK